MSIEDISTSANKLAGELDKEVAGKT